MNVVLQVIKYFTKKRKLKELKKLKISTELASAVLGKEVTKCSLISMARSSINITYFEDEEDFNTVWKEWNIYELAHKCKEWAYLQYGIIIQSYLYNGKWRVDILKGIEIDEFFKNIDSEPEAIIEACNYILDNLSNK